MPTFYEYISSFPDGEHMWEYAPSLHPVIEEGAKSYFAIDFKRGAKLEERTLSLAKNKLMDVALNCRKVDEARATKIVQTAKVETPTPRLNQNSTGDLRESFEEEEHSDDEPSAEDIAAAIPW